MSDAGSAPPPSSLVGKAAHNERRKLLATTANAVGLAIFAVGALQPLLSGSLSTLRVLAAALCVMMFVALHLAAQRVLKSLQD